MLLTPTTGVVPKFTQSDRLRKAREVTGLDQGQFAELAGISRQTVSNYESGTREPRGLYLRAWAEASGVDLGWLETGTAPAEAEAEPGLSQHSVRPKRLELPTFCMGVKEWTLDDDVALMLFAASDAVKVVR
jgi:transcriptional regulator with XRE-family HTH domain